jgi:hypothetical protein
MCHVKHGVFPLFSLDFLGAAVYWEFKKLKIQQEMDKNINELQSTNVLKDACSAALITTMNDCQEDELTRISKWQIYEDLRQ